MKILGIAYMVLFGLLGVLWLAQVVIDAVRFNLWGSPLDILFTTAATNMILLASLGVFTGWLILKWRKAGQFLHLKRLLIANLVGYTFLNLIWLPLFLQRDTFSRIFGAPYMIDRKIVPALMGLILALLFLIAFKFKQDR